MWCFPLGTLLRGRDFANSIFVRDDHAVGQGHAETFCLATGKVNGQTCRTDPALIQLLFNLVRSFLYCFYILRQAEVSTFVTFVLSRNVREHDMMRRRWVMEDTTKRACEPHYFFNCQPSDPCQPCGWTYLNRSQCSQAFFLTSQNRRTWNQRSHILISIKFHCFGPTTPWC